LKGHVEVCGRISHSSRLRARRCEPSLREPVTGKGTPSLSLLRKLARALGVDIDMLVGHEE